MLQTNASDNFWAAVLFERKGEGEEKEEVLCAYASGEFLIHQNNYFPAEKETLAIFNGIQKFELY
ncbi:RNase H-like domain-containing protein, partial [Actinobacillus pleuropneumoniae]|uniref:RNase H-like domain-containing protein n=1 Tax=Actinobacillus pleuropneumoniae TaxID=715 RepID=UPI0034DD49BE